MSGQRQEVIVRVCIVVPMYNEEEIVQNSVETILQYMNERPDVFTLVVVDDGSSDKTGAIVDRMVAQVGDERRLRLIRCDKNGGYGAALRVGIRHAIDHKYDYVLHMDSDLTNHPKYLEKFYEKMAEGWAYIKATRYSKGGRVRGVPWRRRAVSTVGNIIAKRLYRVPLTDITNGFRAVKVSLMEKMRLHESGFVIIMEELYNAKYLTRSFTEVPYTLTSRSEGEGESHFTYGLSAYLQYLKYTIKSLRPARNIDDE